MPQLDSELLNCALALALVSVIISPFSVFLEGSSDFEIEFDFFLTEMFSFLLLTNIHILQKYAMFNYLINFSFYLFFYLSINFLFFFSYVKSSTLSYIFLLLFFLNSFKNFNFFLINIISASILKKFSLPKLSLFQTWEFSCNIQKNSGRLVRHALNS